MEGVLIVLSMPNMVHPVEQGVNLFIMFAI